MELKVTLEGGKRVATRIGDHLIMTDQPTKHGGDNSAPAPYDLFMASIGTCAGFYVQSYCESKGFDSSGIEITLSARRDPDTKQITGFVTTIHVPPELPEKLHTALKKVAEQCAVKKTIMSNPEFVVETISRTV
jgi:ribosomal protein S12 methylthiotransferase accessory factor